MVEADLPWLLQVLQSRIPDPDHRSIALEELVKRRAQWPRYTPTQWVNLCLRVAWCARSREFRGRSWGGRAKTRSLPDCIRHDTLTPAAMYELREVVSDAIERRVRDGRVNPRDVVATNNAR